jgi:peptidoglycan/LPS O-acetylase OafA/YrhL
LFQYPILRVFSAGGQTAVALFFVITGYGSSVSAFAKLRSGNDDGMRSSIAKAALNRPFRIMLPTMLLTTIAWLLTQLGAFRLSSVVDSAWIRDQYAYPSASMAGALEDLLSAQLSTWTKGDDTYDKVQVRELYYDAAVLS